MLKILAFGVLLSASCAVPIQSSDANEQEFDYGSEAENALNKYSEQEKTNLKSIIRRIANEAFAKGESRGYSKGFEWLNVANVKINNVLPYFHRGGANNKDILERFYKNSEFLSYTDHAKFNSVKRDDFPKDILYVLKNNTPWLYKYWMKYHPTTFLTKRSASSSHSATQSSPSETTEPLPVTSQSSSTPPEKWLKDLQDEIYRFFKKWYAIVTEQYDEKLVPHVHLLRSKLNAFKNNNKEVYKNVDINVRFAAFMAISYRIMAGLGHGANTEIYSYFQTNPGVSFKEILFDHLPGWMMTIEQVEFLNLIRNSLPKSKLSPLRVLYLETEDNRKIIVPYDYSVYCDSGENHNMMITEECSSTPTQEPKSLIVRKIPKKPKSTKWTLS